MIYAGVAILCAAWGGVTACRFYAEEFVPYANRPDPQNRGSDPQPLFGAKIDLERFQQIRKGMKYEEVEDLLGGPPGFYETLDGFSFDVDPSLGDKGSRDHSWYGRTACITIRVDESGSVIDKEYCTGKRL